MTAFLPSHLLALFQARPPIPYIPPENEVSFPKYPPYSGISQYLSHFESPEESAANAVNGRNPFETKQSVKAKRIETRLKRHREELEEFIKSWEPAKDEKATGDPYKTLFVGRLSFDTSEHKLKREFETYGSIKKVRVVTNKEGKSRGYGFLEFEKERDLRAAFKQADGRKVDGRRIVVDVERGRTVRNWKPRRLGGGLGFTRRGPESMNQKFSGRDPPLREDDREQDHDRDRGKERDHHHRERSRERRDRDRERDHRDHGRERDRERDREREKEKEKERERDGHHRH